MKTPMMDIDGDSDTAYHFTYFVQNGLEDCIMRLNARLADARARHEASAAEYCESAVARDDALLPGRF